MNKLTRRLVILVPLILGWAAVSAWIQTVWKADETLTILAIVGFVLGWAGVMLAMEWDHRVEMREIRAGVPPREPRKPLIGKDYRPPSFQEFQEVVGDTFDTERDPFGSIRAYDSMCLAMRCKAYDRAEAFDRLHGIVKTNRSMTEAVQRYVEAMERRRAGQ